MDNLLLLKSTCKYTISALLDLARANVYVLPTVFFSSSIEASLFDFNTGKLPGSEETQRSKKLSDSAQRQSRRI